MGCSSNRLSPPLTVARSRSAPSLHGRYPLPRYYGLSDSRVKKPRASQVPSLSFLARCPQSPRRVRRLHSPVASSSMSGFIAIRWTGHSHWCNEAESGSLSLRLASSLHKASSTQIAPCQRLLGYFDERAISKVSSFQLTRSARLSLAHRISRIRAERHDARVCFREIRVIRGRFHSPSHWAKAGFVVESLCSF